MLGTGVVVLNYGDPSDTLRCVRSLEDSTDLDLDLVVVDNGRADERHQQLVDGVGARGTVIATGDNLGYAAGNNAGIAHVLARDSDLVWILNPDTLVEPSTLAALRSHLDAVPACGAVGPRLVLPGTPPRIWFDGGVVDADSARTSHLAQGLLERDVPAIAPIDVDYATGASLLVRREVLEQVGPIPEQYFLYCEEVDWCHRVRGSGWRVMVEPRARMTHLKRSSGATPEPYYIYYMVRNRYHFAQDCLGLNGEHALDVMEDTFVQPWRERVQSWAPGWATAYDELVARAKADARAGVYGRNDEIADYPRADGVMHA